MEVKSESKERMESPDILEWKEEILKDFKKLYFIREWSRYLKRIGKEIDHRDWVSNLGTDDYQEFKQIDLNAGQWMVKRWENDDTNTPEFAKTSQI